MGDTATQMYEYNTDDLYRRALQHKRLNIKTIDELMLRRERLIGMSATDMFEGFERRINEIQEETGKGSLELPEVVKFLCSTGILSTKNDIIYRCSVNAAYSMFVRKMNSLGHVSVVVRDQMCGVNNDHLHISVFTNRDVAVQTKDSIFEVTKDEVAEGLDPDVLT